MDERRNCRGAPPQQVEGWITYSIACDRYGMPVWQQAFCGYDYDRKGRLAADSGEEEAA